MTNPNEPRAAPSPAMALAAELNQKAKAILTPYSLLINEIIFEVRDDEVDGGLR